VIDQVAQLVQEAEGDPAVPARHAQVDRIAFPQPVATGLAYRRRGADGHRIEVCVEHMNCVGGGKRSG